MSQPRRPRHLATAVVLVGGLAITAVLAYAAAAAQKDNEDRLLKQRTDEVAAVLTAAVPSIEAPMAVTADLVGADTNADAFRQVMATQVGEGKRFASAALLSADGSAPPVVVGPTPALLQRAQPEIDRYLERAMAADGLALLDLVDEAQPRLGYGLAVPGNEDRYLIYAEILLPPDRTDRNRQESAFADLDYALYLDTPDSSRTLVTASTGDLPFQSRHGEKSTPFGDGALILVVAPSGDLGGSLLARLPWIVVAAGATMTIGATVLTERLQRRRRQAEVLTDEVTALYDDQRAAALTLQQSLLPRELPHIPDVEVEVRYSPGVEGTEVGGDWYEVVDLGPRTVLVVGDVSGRGLIAASVMAAVRHSIRAYATQGDAPDTILAKANQPDAIDLAGHFATVLCAVLDRETGTLTVATAGHPPPIVIEDGRSRFVELSVGRPIGADVGAAYESTSTSLEPGAAVLLFTDGLFERRGESIDVSLERLRQAADGAKELGDVVEAVFETMGAGSVADDAAILAVRWTG